MKKFLAILIFSMAFSFPAMAGEWKQDAAGYWWQDDDGNYPSGSWKWIDGNQDGTAECYYFNENGYLLVAATTPDGYTVDANGCWVVDGIVQTQAVSADTTDQNTTAAASSTFNFENDNIAMKYVSHELGTDKYGKSCVIIYYDYTNKMAGSKSAIWTTLTTVYQNGVECDYGYIPSGTNPAIAAYFEPIPSGTTIRVAESFVITDLSDITVTVSEFLLDTPTSQPVTLKLQ